MALQWTRFVGLGILASCASALAFLTQKKILNRRSSSKSPSHSTTYESKRHPYEYGLLELSLPCGRDKLLQIVRNDFMISRVVKDIGRTLFVAVASLPNHDESDMMSYVSELYARLWDEIIQNSNYSLKCVVVSDCCNLRPMEDILQLPDLQVVYHSSDSDRGLQLYREKRLNSNLPELQVIDLKNSTMFTDSMFYLDAPGQNLPKYKKVALGGTFDRLHNGHRKLLTLAAAVCTDELVVGVMSDELLQKKKGADLIESFEKRHSAVRDFLSLIKPSLALNLPKLLDPFGPTIVDGSIDAIVVSSETISGALAINSRRTQKEMKPLAVLITRRSDAASLSSTFIREQEGKYR